MATQTIDAVAFASSHPDIAKRTSVSGLILSAVMLLAGVILFAFTLQITDKSSAANMGLMVGGTTLVLFGLFRMFLKAKEMVYLPTGSVTKEQSLYFDVKHLSRLSDMLEHRQLSAGDVIKSDGSGNVRMDAMVSQDSQFAAVQLFQFVPYNYTPVTSLCYFTGSDAAAVCAFLSKCKTS